MRALPLLIVLLTQAVAGAAPAPAPAPPPPDEYLERYFAFYPTRATAAGRHDLDTALEDLTPERRREWADFNRLAVAGFRRGMADPTASADDRLDAELLWRQAELEVFDHGTLRTPERDPLFWTGLLGDATVFLLVRDDLPLDDRLARVAARADLVPRLARQAREALAATPPSEISQELCRLAAGQARAAATLYRESLPKAAEGRPAELVKRVAASGVRAAAAVDELAVRHHWQRILLLSRETHDVDDTLSGLIGRRGGPRRPIRSTCGAPPAPDFSVVTWGATGAYRDLSRALSGSMPSSVPATLPS